jgi:DNA-binding MarR family transcriptional regulator
MVKKSRGDINKLVNVQHEDVFLRTFILLVQSALAVLKYTDTTLYKKLHLSKIKLIVLQVLAHNNGIMTPSELAEWTQTERHNITALVARMRQDELVSTERNSSNKRFVNIILTDKGREVLIQAMPVAKEIVSQVMSSITKGDAALLEKLLRVLRQNAQ